MAFESLSDKLQNAFKKLKGKGVLTEADINDAMREVKLALLEADVNFKVVKGFVSDVKEKCLGAEVLESLTPAQQIIKIVNQELVDLMGGTGSKLTYSPSGFTTIMMVGLQGTGKTTTCGKLANYLKQHGKKPMLCACDVYRAGGHRPAGGSGKGRQHAGVHHAGEAESRRRSPKRPEKKPKRRALTSSSSIRPDGCRSTRL